MVSQRSDRYCHLTESEANVIVDATYLKKVAKDSKCSLCHVEFVMCLTFFIALIALVLLCSSDLLSIAFENKEMAPMFNPPRFSNVSASSNVCFTEACIREAGRILNSIDRNFDPCENFYEFACSGWVKKHRLPKNVLYDSVFHDAKLAISNKIGDMLSLPMTKNDSRWMKLVKTMDRSCMDTTALNKLGLKPLVHYLKKLGGWPVVEGAKWNESNHDWVDIIRRLRLFGGKINSLMTFKLHYMGTGRYVLVLDDPALPFESTFEDMMNLAVKLGADKKSAEMELKKIINLRRTLSRVWTFFSGLGNVEKLEKLAPKFPWRMFLKAALGMNFRNESIYVQGSVSGVYAVFLQVDNRTLVNYLVWSFIRSMFPALPGRPKPYATKDSTMYPNGASDSGPMRGSRDFCASNAAIQPLLLFHNYVLHYSFTKVKKLATMMITGIQKQLFKLLETADWLSPKTKQYAIEKAHSMILNVAYPEEILSNKFLESLFDVNYTLSEKHFFQNILTATKWMYGFRLKLLLLNEVNRGHTYLFMLELMQVNAAYSSIRNAVFIPFGILGGAFFNPDRPNYMNFGAIGSVLGHEMSHGFDNSGRYFDKEGKASDWWDEDSNYNFLRKGQCMINQFSNYSYPELEMNVNGGMTLPENIADNVGVKESYRAYLNYTAIHGQEQLLPSLNYTARQMFWVSLGSIWCTRYHPNMIRYLIMTNEHTTLPFRVNGLVSNFKEFSEDFHCPPGSPMNPSKKCIVW